MPLREVALRHPLCVRLKIFDVVIVLFSLIIVFLSIYFAYIKPSERAQVLIQTQNEEWLFNIESQETITVEGPIGKTVVRISGGYAWVESSPCDNKNCVAIGFIRRHGQWAACLPNQVLVMVKADGSGSGRGGDEVDAVSW